MRNYTMDYNGLFIAQPREFIEKIINMLKVYFLEMTQMSNIKNQYPRSDSIS